MQLQQNKFLGESVIIILSSWCNLSCYFCLQNANATLDPKEITSTDIIAFLDTVSNLNFLQLTGGEPLSPPVYQKMYDVAKYAVEERGCLIKINTNGTFKLPESFSLRPSVEMFNFSRTDSGIEFQLSLDGFEDTHDTIRGKGTFNKAVDFIRDVTAKGYRVSIMSTLPLEPDPKYVDRFIRFCNNLGSYSTTVRIIQPVGKADSIDRGSLRQIDLDALTKVAENAGGHVRERVYECDACIMNQWGRLGIDQYGNIIPCPNLREYNSFGNIFNFNYPYILQQFKQHIVDKGVTCDYPEGRK